MGRNNALCDSIYVLNLRAGNAGVRGDKNMANHLAGDMLIAETDEEGNVACVWIKPDNAPFPRPIRRRALKLPIPDLDRYRVAGAPRDDILAWIGLGSPQA